jgi:hypothetical protein
MTRSPAPWSRAHDSRCCGTTSQHTVSGGIGSKSAALSARPIQASDMISRMPLTFRCESAWSAYPRGTFVVTSIALEKQLEFWWDQLEAIVTSPTERDTLELHLDGARKVDLGSRRDRRQAHTRRALAPPQGQLRRTYVVEEFLRDLGEAERKRCLVHLAEQIDTPRAPREISP